MGSCLSKKNDNKPSSKGISATNLTSLQSINPNKKLVQEEEVTTEAESSRCRKPNYKLSPIQNIPDVVLLSSSTCSIEETCNGNTFNGVNTNNVLVSTSSCTTEELDAILIQCGRLSRNNSFGKTPSSTKKHSGSKRSNDFDHSDLVNDLNGAISGTNGGADVDSKGKETFSLNEDEEGRENRNHRHRDRQLGRDSPLRRRRTPSRERDQQHKQQRSGSSERGYNRRRRVSRSPGKRSETTTSSATNASLHSGSANKPEKMVSVPATVSSIVKTEKNNDGAASADGVETTISIKRIHVRRNVGETSGNVRAASPRSQSPARTNTISKGLNENAKVFNENQQLLLSRRSSRKDEELHERRSPLSEIDSNSLAFPVSAANKASCANINTSVQYKNKEIHVQGMPKESTIVEKQKQHPETNNNKVVSTNKVGDEQQLIPSSDTEGLKPQTLTKSRSSRKSRDLDINPEASLNSAPTPYTTLLLEDIQNFHQKTAAPPSFSLLPCLAKARSILDAVADLSSTPSSSLSSLSEERRSAPPGQYSKNECNLVEKKLEDKDPFVESEVLVTDDLTEPSFHKYITVP